MGLQKKCKNKSKIHKINCIFCNDNSKKICNVLPKASKALYI